MDILTQTMAALQHPSLPTLKGEAGVLKRLRAMGFQPPCARCEGTGRVALRACFSCDGSGVGFLKITSALLTRVRAAVASGKLEEYVMQRAAKAAKGE